jgi:hypothetical protein
MNRWLDIVKNDLYDKYERAGSIPKFVELVYGGIVLNKERVHIYGEVLDRCLGNWMQRYSQNHDFFFFFFSIADLFS